MFAEIRARLKDQVPALKLVGGAVEFAAIAESGPAVFPAAYVLPLAEAPAANGLGSGGVEQRVGVAFGLVYVVRNLGDARGEAAATDLETLRRAAIAALLGWQPLATHDEIERGPSNLLAFRDQAVWWQDEFATAYYDRSL